MKPLRLLPITILAASAFCSCNDGSENIGSSLVADNVEIIRDSSFTVAARSIDNNTLKSRTLTQLLGMIDAEGYGSLTSEIVTQFMPVMTLDTIGVRPEDVDSVQLQMFMSKGSFTGDSLMPMGVKVFPLTRQLPSPIFSDFDPADYYSNSDILGQSIYTANALYNDSANSLSFRNIIVDLPRQFGVDLYKEYYSNPTTFQTPEAFAKWFPGLYISNSFGSGRVVQLYQTRLTVYYTKHATITTDDVTRDTTYANYKIFAEVSPEVITNNNLSYHMAPALSERISNGEAIIAAPTGTDVELTIPLEEMISTYRSKGGSLSVFNTLTIEIPAEELTNTYGINPPDYLLMVLSSEKNDFFNNNKLPDNSTSFYTSYNSTKKMYVFSGMRQYFIDMLKKEGEITADDFTFTLTPIETEFSQTGSSYATQSVLSVVSPYVLGPTMVKINTEKIKIRMEYSKQNINF